MKLISVRVFSSCIAIAGALAGCSADPGPSPSTGPDTSDAAVLAKLQSLQLSTSDVEIEDRIVRVDGDMVFEKAVLMDGGYDYIGGGDELVEKGYKSSSGKPVTTPSKIKLVLQMGSLWPLAAESAAATWSNRTNGRIDIYEGSSGTGGTITVKAVSGASWPSGSTCAAADWACVSAWPSGGKPSPIIYVKSQLNPFGNAGQCEWTIQTLTDILIHEFGHSVGFRHPGEGFHISGTASCTNFNADGSCNTHSPGYGTVMHKGLNINASCNPANSLDNDLTADDVKSANTVYP